MSEKNTAETSEPSSVSFSDAWDELDNTENDSHKNLRKDLTELAETGKLTIETLKNTDGASDWLNEYSIDAGEATQKINKMSSSTEQLASMKTGISSISSILGQKKDGINLNPTSAYEVVSSATTHERKFVWHNWILKSQSNKHIKNNGTEKRRTIVW